MSEINKSRLISISKQPIIALLSSTIFLLAIFVVTIFKHNDGIFEWGIYVITFLIIVVASIMPAIAVKLANISKWYWSVLIGMVLGLVSLAIFNVVIISAIL